MDIFLWGYALSCLIVKYKDNDENNNRITYNDIKKEIKNNLMLYRRILYYDRKYFYTTKEKYLRKLKKLKMKLDLNG